MQLLTQELEKSIPALYEQEMIKEKKAFVKFFTPDSHWTWYVMEYDPINKIFFGLVEGFETEFGYFSLQELEELTGPTGLKIERDLYFTPTLLKDLP